MNDMRVSGSNYTPNDHGGGHHIHGDSHHVHGANHPGGANAAANRTAPEPMPVAEAPLTEPQLPGGVQQLMEIIMMLLEMIKNKMGGESSDADAVSGAQSNPAIMQNDDSALPEGPAQNGGEGVKENAGGAIQQLMGVIMMLLEMIKNKAGGESSDTDAVSGAQSNPSIMQNDEAVLPEGPAQTGGDGVEESTGGGFLEKIQELMQVMLQFSIMQQLLSSFGGLFGGGDSSSSGGGLFGGSRDPFGSDSSDDSNNNSNSFF